MATERFYSNSWNSWTAPKDQTITIEVYGAQGGDSGSTVGGHGGYIKLEYDVIYGDTLDAHAGYAGETGEIDEGGHGGPGYQNGKDGEDAGYNGEPLAGGGGGSCAIKDPSNNIIATAGGGGGAGESGDENNANSGGSGGGPDGGSGGSAKNNGDGGGASANTGTVITSETGYNVGRGYIDITYEEITPPSQVATSENGDASVDISWTDDSNYEDNYEVWRGNSSNVTTSDTLVATLAAETTSYKETPSEDNIYYYSVRATNDYSQVMSNAESKAKIATVKLYDAGTSSFNRKLTLTQENGSFLIPSSISGNDGGLWK